ncbi:MAG TPA: phosphoribosylglycinamide formyltransferase [Oligoflexia bacterium]|nr:phosphoribosylglycinamide formyltransferase [Oligoflexia bacterium]HMP48739.1 phosphoribosylglycinamide formyltransferase [Oligoflexia bacterium]
MIKKPSFCILCSGQGSNMIALVKATEDETIPASICGIISNRPDSPALIRARERNIPTYIIAKPDMRTSTNNLSESGIDQSSQGLDEIIEKLSPDFIVLAGYLKKIPTGLINKYPDRIINIHPSLLPDFGGAGMYGRRVHEAVLQEGRKESGFTIHLVTEEYDKGPILLQHKVEVRPDDTPESLENRIKQKEHLYYPQYIAKFVRENF